MKRIALPLDEIEVLDGELLMIRGGVSSIMSVKGSGSGCGCGCDCGCAEPDRGPDPVVNPGKR